MESVVKSHVSCASRLKCPQSDLKRTVVTRIYNETHIDTVCRGQNSLSRPRKHTLRPPKRYVFLLLSQVLVHAARSAVRGLRRDELQGRVEQEPAAPATTAAKDFLTCGGVFPESSFPL